jgi:UDP-galactopyranose mutase
MAEQAASVRGWRSLVIDRRPHLAGNCFDSKHEGVLVHRYGPHYFRTDDERLVRYLSRFTGWIEGRYIVRASHRGQLYPIPVNRRTLEMFFGVRLASDQEAEALLATVRVPIAEPQNAEEFALSRVGRELYEAFVLGYTLKQWERHPRYLAPWLLGRLPVRTDLDERYVPHRFQLMPAAGFTAMFGRMLDHPLVEVRLGVDFADLRGKVVPRIATVYAGPVDEYFGHAEGRLPWRSLEFDYQLHRKPWVQPCVQINYPGAEPFTRTVEAKHVTGQEHPHTVVVREFSRASGDPYYPVPEAAAQAMAARYAVRAEAERARRVWFVGRLAEYRYLNTDEAITRALSAFEEIRCAV